MKRNRLYVDHLGIIVNDLSKAAAILEEVFGLQVDRIIEMKDVGAKVAFVKTQNLQLELIQYITDGATFAKEVMGKRMGLNHLCFRVKDLDGVLRRMSDAGLVPLKGFPRKGAHGRIAFLNRDKTCGIFIELCEREDDDEGPDRETAME